ncbi:MAG: alpha-2-macroglobulin [Bacteroidetes bacterium]|nr:alpha-2-macroglobulin [Bacteroidota bacterium]
MPTLKSMLLTTCTLFSILISYAQTSPRDYDRKWALVDSLLNKKGLIRSAMGEVNSIYARARKEKNEPQQIKALIYRSILYSRSQEDPEQTTIQDLDSAIVLAQQPSRSILQNLLAGVYQQYFLNHEWQLYNRSNTAGFVKKDIATWSADDFNNTISALYLASLKDEQQLKATRLDRYDPILIKGNVRYLRPTLFDLLAHRALEYFKRSDRNANKPADIFELDDSLAFSDAATFTRHLFKTSDTASLHYKALSLLQRLIGMHLGDTRPDALIDADIERLAFVNTYGVMENKEELYTQALSRITRRYEDEPAAAQAWYLQASRLVYPGAVRPLRIRSKGDENQAEEGNTGDSLRYSNVKALAICERVLLQKDSSEGREHCRTLRDQLLAKQLAMQAEKVNLPGEPLRCLVRWSNFDHLYLRLISLEGYKTTLPNINTGDDKFWSDLFNQPIYRSFDQALPHTRDYRQHSTEMAIGRLPVGAYALVGCTDAGFSSTSVMAVQYIYVSGIAFVNKGRDYFVLRRGSGQPITDASIHLWTEEYNPRLRKQDLVKAAVQYRTDSQGHFQLLNPAANEAYRPRMIEITTADDHLFIRDQALGYDLGNMYDGHISDDDNYEELNAKVFLFLDRQIYRPGQTVYFKGIAITKDKATHQSKVLDAWSTKVYLYNANSEAVDSTDMKTNEFGSYHGSFQLPVGQLNGSFRVEDDKGNSASFSVEEYKRPTFYVEYEKQKGSYRAGDSIHVTGNSKAYAGNALDGATVRYRVIRRTVFPHPWYFGRIGRPAGGVQEIQHGELKTDGKGNFRVGFLAIPDRSANRSADPRFEYDVTADVTDINGETRSGATTIVAGYTALNLSLVVPGGDRQRADSLKQLMVKSTNLAGEPVASTVHVTIYPLKAPDQLIRARLWEKPDLYVLPEKEYRDSFPHDEYRDELQKDSWTTTEQLWDGTGSSASGTAPLQFEVPAGRTLPGWYRVEAVATDAYGQEVKDLRYIELFDGKTGKPANPRYDWIPNQDQTVEPGAMALIEAGSSAADVYVIRKTEHIDTSGSFSTFTLNGQRRVTEQAITEADRGGLGISDIFVKDNRFYTHRLTIRVPWTNKALDIHYASYRDKSQPGSNEKWSVTISGQQRDKVSAEVLASMYDASLDQFELHQWTTPSVYPEFTSPVPWLGSSFVSGYSVTRVAPWNYVPQYAKVYDELLSTGSGSVMMFRKEGRVLAAAAAPQISIRGQNPAEAGNEPQSIRDGVLATAAEGSRAGLAQQLPGLRKNFNETAFFFPDLRTDSNGSVSFSFTMPEALTSWKWMTLAHTKDLAFGYSEKTVITQKELMVQPNTPRFLREGDHMDLPVKVVNLTDSEMTGQVALQLTDPTTGQTADGWFTNRQPNQYFTVGPRQSIIVSFPLVVPFQYNRPLTYKLTAQSHSYSDGEEATLPVVSNRLLVTETLPLNMKGDGTRLFTFEKLLHSGNSETLNHHALTVEFTANPVWYAVQSLPYLTEYPYECAEQTFNRWYANALASRIVSASPRLKDVFQRWKSRDTAALLSNLQKNQELRSVLLEETPWVLRGKTEEQQKKNVALLFDMSRMSAELEATFGKLKAMQSPDGGFAWFNGGPTDLYITQYILTGIGHLQQLKAIPEAAAPKVSGLIRQALAYVDEQMKKKYESLKEDERRSRPLPSGKPIAPPIGELPVQYLYMRSFFNDYGIPGSILPAVSYFRKQVQGTWVSRSKYMQGMIALALFRTGDVQTAKDIIRSLKQTAIVDEEKGMYWKGMEGGYYWYEAPIEIQSLLIEAFREISADKVADRDLKTWLLKQKQTHSWRTTKATADACYALLVGDTGWTIDEKNVTIKLGEKLIEQAPGEVGTGYFKKVFDAPFINPAMGNITVTMSSGRTAGAGSPAWGAVYWQYFDLLDKITPPGGGKTPLSITKRLFIERITSSGRVLDPVADNGVLKPGDKVVVRIQLKADRSMEYVHMKDMRAACMEPVNVISRYKWQDGLGYYESTRDASTDFFFPSLPRGTYIFEYPLTVGQAGNFSNGITTIECMYAPEFAYHSEGIRVSVEAAP